MRDFKPQAVAFRSSVDSLGVTAKVKASDVKPFVNPIKKMK